MALKDQITDDMKTAMRAKDSARLGTIRLLLSACKQKEVDERVTLDDAAELRPGLAQGDLGAGMALQDAEGRGQAADAAADHHRLHVAQPPPQQDERNWCTNSTSALARSGSVSLRIP